MANLVIGIEGHVGAGKTSICRNLIKKMPNTILLNGGNLYRAIIYSLMNTGKNLKELKEKAEKINIKQLMDFFNINLKIENNETVIYIGDKKIDEEKLQSKEASIAVSSIGGRANEKELFDFAKELIDNLKNKYNVIISGRGIMNIYPKTDYHFFITADLEERVKRKCIQYNNENKEDIRKNIIERDNLQEKAGYYKIEDNSIVIDVTECKTIEESTDKVLENINIQELVNI
ncbi:MAG: (d)CMP kinase [Candidatus Scatovivens sp.]